MRKQNWIYDRYVIQAGDAAATNCARAYTPRQGLVTVSGSTAKSSYEGEPWILRFIQVVLAPAGAASVRQGVGISVFPYAYSMDIPAVHLVDMIQGKNRICQWEGEFPIPWGLVWHIWKGGALATDELYCKLCYESGRR